MGDDEDDFEDDFEDEDAPAPPDLTVWPTEVDDEPVLYLPDGTGLFWFRPPFGFCSQKR